MVSTQTSEPKVRQRVRIRFCKRGDLRLIGHRDLVRLMERLFRRAELPLGMSEGFHPKPRMSFPSALALGVEGADELMELELTERLDAETIRDRLEKQTVPGLSFRSVELLSEKGKRRSAGVQRVRYEIPIPPERASEIDASVQQLLACDTYTVTRPKRSTSIDLMAFLERLSREGDRLSITFRVTPQANPGPRDVLAALELDDLESQGYGLIRTAVEVEPAVKAEPTVKMKPAVEVKP